MYDDLRDEWESAGGAFAALHWLAAARAALIPPAHQAGQANPAGAGIGVRPLLLDLACGGGLLAARVDGYRHVGVDLVDSALQVAAGGGVLPVCADVLALPFPDGCADVVVAGEIFEHVRDLDRAVAETARVLKPGGTVVVDTINDTWWSRFSLVTVGERLPGGPPPGCHDPGLFVRPQRLRRLFARHSIVLRVRGLRFSVRDYLRFLVWRETAVRMLPTRSLAAVYQGVGRKAPR
jgi:2-polyprenyl-6-hydroxyphenyl methylase/3-demethylubiquinone-9 3-methyltransferase